MGVIISFANQKGGVGKTTLCTTFANFLALKRESLLVIDCDSQKSIIEKRDADRRKYSEQEFSYNVQSFDIKEKENVIQLMYRLKTLDGIILIDTPGHLSQQGLIALFAHSDFIVCPYQYEATTINSTITFLQFYKKLKEVVPEMKAKLLLVANRYDKRIGTKAELDLWEQTDAAFSNYGEILPRIDIKADMQRYNTVSLLDSQIEIVRDTYNRIFDLIKQ